MNEKENNRQKKIEELSKQLEEGVKVFQNSQTYKDYLSFVAKFHNYSFNNTLLIYMQRPDFQWPCAGYSVWRDKFKRYVRPGEKGAKIICPAFKEVEVEKKDKTTGKTLLDEKGKPVMEKVTIPRYTVGTVFSVEQTESLNGEPIPEFITELKGDVYNYQKIFEAAESTTTAKVIFEDIKNGAKGYFSPNENKIVINTGMDELQNIKTLLHEIGHSKCDNIENKNRKDLQADKAGKEIRAESIAFICAKRFNLDVDSYSFPYINSYSSMDFKELQEQMTNIQKYANEIITGMEKYLGIEENKLLTESKIISKKFKKNTISQKSKKGKRR